MSNTLLAPIIKYIANVVKTTLMIKFTISAAMTTEKEPKFTCTLSQNYWKIFTNFDCFTIID
jgi:hypothetical protein